MTATIYVTKEAMATLDAIRGLDYYSRCELSDDPETDVSNAEGYYLKSDTKLKVAILPDDADVALHFTPLDLVSYAKHVSIPTELRGCIFEQAPHLPKDYAEIVRYWSGETVNSNTSGAVYYQNPLNEYMVDLSALQAEGTNETVGLTTVDALLSEGVAVRLSGLANLVTDLNSESYLEILVPVQMSMLGLENDSWRSGEKYPVHENQRCERFFLKIADILRSPDPDAIYVDILRYEMLDYGYFY